MYAVLNCDNTVRCGTLAEACAVAADWFPEGWDARPDPAWPLGRINAHLREAYGRHDDACPEIVEE
jgi:hypothetical protein